MADKLTVSQEAKRIKDISGNVIELGRMAESTILNILSKSLAEGKLSRPAFDGLRNKLLSEAELRESIAEQIRIKMLPICICERCDNLLEGRLIQEVIRLVTEGS